MSPSPLLVDVRTPSEFATGHLPTAINIEYQLIDSLLDRPAMDSSSDIVLYCRSGRRSAIALDTLKALGLKNVRDIGGLEEAKDTWEKMSAEARAQDVSVSPATSLETRATGDKDALQKSLRQLLEGLRDAE